MNKFKLKKGDILYRFSFHFKEHKIRVVELTVEDVAHSTVWISYVHKGSPQKATVGLHRIDNEVTTKGTVKYVTLTERDVAKAKELLLEQMSERREDILKSLKYIEDNIAALEGMELE